jgi:hypothetical protein
MGMPVDLCIMAGMIVLMGTVISPVFMVMHMGLCLVFMLMQVLVEMLMGVFMRMLMAVFCIAMGMFMLVLMGVRMSM